ncbi:unnamed protein product [Amoebophrya sp. A120]|nr:unnamed protein product [Amoebophrya sp. A120]|eukprot:GSA120T00008565001.1
MLPSASSAPSARTADGSAKAGPSSADADETLNKGIARNVDQRPESSIAAAGEAISSAPGRRAPADIPSSSTTPAGSTMAGTSNKLRPAGAVHIPPLKLNLPQEPPQSVLSAQTSASFGRQEDANNNFPNTTSSAFSFGSSSSTGQLARPAANILHPAQQTQNLSAAAASGGTGTTSSRQSANQLLLRKGFLKKREIKPVNPDHPIVFLDIRIGSREVGRLEIELNTTVTPKTAENFRCLCTGELGLSRGYYVGLHYLDHKFFRVCPKIFAQAGDIVEGTGISGESIYGEFFEDENFELKHEYLALSMANSGKDTNGSQFFICFRAIPELDGKNVVFGRVLEKSKKVAESIRDTGSETGATTEPVTISMCGQLS